MPPGRRPWLRWAVRGQRNGDRDPWHLAKSGADNAAWHVTSSGEMGERIGWRSVSVSRTCESGDATLKHTLGAVGARPDGRMGDRNYLGERRAAWIRRDEMRRVSGSDRRLFRR